MIRRGFWLATGAVLGVAGYRKASRLARDLTRGALGGPAAASPARRRLAAPQAAGPEDLAVLPRQQTPRQRATPPVARVAAAASFIKDVRDGAADYMELHRRE